MADVDIQRYLDDIESQHASKPKYMAHVTALLEKVDDVTRVVKDMPRAFYVRDAVGAQLDVDGGIVGVDRRFPPVSIPGMPALLDDDTFRKVLLARIVQNGWDGTNERFKEMWDATVGGELDAIYFDNQDMSMDIHITGYTEPTMIEMILRGFIVPKPGGVGLNVEMTDDTVLEGGPMNADTDVFADSAKIGVNNHLDTETEAAETLCAAAKASSSSSKLGVHCHIDVDTETLETVLTGCCASASSARILIPLHIPDEQSDTDTVSYGARAYANSSRVAVATN
ncbi:MAG: DUF2612 domain-containing protein [Clostridia bacterium]|nr:DUF2612 domain-containing protein [Clostridia bacterium]MBQ6120575.1 DUF2612 domain-containing protein [Clostridia bacterium]